MNVSPARITADQIFNVTKDSFESLALQVFHFQMENNALLAQYVKHLRRSSSFASLLAVPPLPISFFKTHEVKSFDGDAEIIFTSSGTTGMHTSRHLVKSADWYTRSFLEAFQFFYGKPEEYAFLCLLPSYLERSGSSLVFMAEKLVQISNYAESGFFLKADALLFQNIASLQAKGAKIVLLGVSFALLDFAENHAGLNLEDVIIMETGGMKGRREEITRAQMHEILCKAFNVKAIHSEYGMTELMSQAYSKGGGIYQLPPWMKVLVRREDDPFSLAFDGAGILTIVDLANLYSCSVIETQDVGRVWPDGSFEVLGRLDNSDLRGCSLLVV